jgi:CDP-diglyceride synthetase
MNSNQYKIFSIISILFIIFSYSILILMEAEEFRKIAKEDGFIEVCSALSFFISAIFMIYLYFVNSNSHQSNRRNIFILLLGIFFFSCFGEEISWGQRIFNIDTPEFMTEINDQNEINIHNIYVFQSNADRKGFSKLITSAMLFNFFWFTYCVLIPILNYFSQSVKELVKKLSFPLVPLFFMPYFLLNFIIINVLENQSSMALHDRYGELTENNYAILFLLISVSFFLTNKQKYRYTLSQNEPDPLDTEEHTSSINKKSIPAGIQVSFLKMEDRIHKKSEG